MNLREHRISESTKKGRSYGKVTVKEFSLNREKKRWLSRAPGSIREVKLELLKLTLTEKRKGSFSG